MAKGKAIDTLTGDYGTVTAGQEFTTSAGVLKDLVARGLAEAVSEEDTQEEADEKEAAEKKKGVRIKDEKNKQAGPAETKVESIKK
jgi:CRISPR/Cas system-associated protein Csm6